MDKTKLIDSLAEFISLLAKQLPCDVTARLTEMRNREKNPSASALYDAMFQNTELAKSMGRPLCQDTGLVQFYCKVGTRFPLIDDLNDIFLEATKIATERAPLRHNAVETFLEYNTGSNTGTKAPWVETELIPHGDKLEITVYMAGGGSSLPGRSVVFMPSAGYDGIADFVLETVTTLGINACPPLVVGVGVGTCVASAAELAKKASFRTVGSHHPIKEVADYEKKLFDAINKIGIGPQGLGGAESCLCVNVECAARHPSTLAAAVSFGCWAHRRGIVTVENEKLISSTHDFEVKL